MHRSFVPCSILRPLPCRPRPSARLCGNSLVPCECLMGHQFRRIRRPTTKEGRRKNAGVVGLSPPPSPLSNTDAVSKPPLLNATVNGVGRQDREWLSIREVKALLKVFALGVEAQSPSNMTLGKGFLTAVCKLQDLTVHCSN